MAQVEKLLIFLAAPGDVQKECSWVHKVVEELNRTVASQKDVVLQVVNWQNDAFPGFGTDTQSIINAQIADMARYSLFVGIMWNRLGTPTPRAASGTVEEFERAEAAWGLHAQPTIWFYFRDVRGKLDADALSEQQKRVLEFKKRVQGNGFPWSYRSPSDFPGKFREHLVHWLGSVKPGMLPEEVNPLVTEAYQGRWSKELHERLDTIRIFQSLTDKSERHHARALAALAALIRKQAPWKPGVISMVVGEDVKSALTLICQIPKKQQGSTHPVRVDIPNVDLSGVSLRGVVEKNQQSGRRSIMAAAESLFVMISAVRLVHF